MSCIGPGGALTPSASRLLRALQNAVTPAEVAKVTELSLPRVRSGLRELVTAGLAAAEGDGFRRTPEGDAKLASPETA